MDKSIYVQRYLCIHNHSVLFKLSDIFCRCVCECVFGGADLPIRPDSGTPYLCVFLSENAYISMFF